MLQHITQILRLRADAGRDVRQQRLLAQIELHHARNIGVDHFVVGHASSGRVGQGHLTGLINLHQPAHPKHGIASKHLRIQEIIVNPPVNDIHAFEAAGGAHADAVIDHHEVTALDQFNAHLLGQE